jgi:hypothetical protein
MLVTRKVWNVSYKEGLECSSEGRFGMLVRGKVWNEDQKEVLEC